LVLRLRLWRLGWLLLAALAAAPPAFAAAPATPAAEGRFDTVVVDAGHGGDDHGAKGPRGLLEKNLVLDVARRLAKRLERQELRVVMTRDADHFVPLDARTRIANDAGADLFVSIHANASALGGVHGIETFFASLEATDESARALAQRENLAFGAAAGGGGAADPVLAILGDLLATEHLADAQEFARMTQRRLATAEASRSRGVKQAPFVVLMGVQMPAVLVEIGFLTNSAEEGRLGGDPERERLAGGIADAVASFKRRQDARLGFAEAGSKRSAQ
jgi:N-acetylmuramoyl-L-alanine amidase